MVSPRVNGEVLVKVNVHGEIKREEMEKLGREKGKLVTPSLGTA